MNTHGAVPFWFWNGDQQADELSRQLDLASVGGFRGLAIHARRGNLTPYMSARWLGLVRHCCEEARRLGLDIWLYDEEGFPSGSVGGRLQKGHPSLQHKQLKYGYMTGKELAAQEGLLATYDAMTYERVAPREVPQDGEALAFWVIRKPNLVDMLKRETSERFMEMTHRVYARELAEYFGNPITHIYTDDLYSLHGYEDALPFTEELPERLASQKGVDLHEILPALVENLPGSAKARLLFRGAVLELFLQNFVAPMQAWCEAHGLQLTGHLCGDEGTIEKSVARFGAAMPFYEYEHTPGIDDFLCTMPDGAFLDRLRNPQDHCPPVIFKQAASVGNQLKDGRCGCECLTYLGWGAPVAGQAVILNYELALGVNLFTHHALSYATGGVAKRDCPPSYFFQQPYWRGYQHLNAAVQRSTGLLKRGTYDASVLVIHPATSSLVALDGAIFGRDDGFVCRHSSAIPRPRAFEDCLAGISNELLRLRVGFEYGDEGILARHADVDAGALRVGRMAYTTVIIPQVCNLAASTVDLLARFQTAGGRLIAISPSPDCLLDGELPSDPLLGKVLTPDVIAAPAELRGCGLPDTSELMVKEPGAPVICHSRIVAGGREHFVFNVSNRTQSLGWGGELQAYDPVGHACIATDFRTLLLPPFHAIHLLADMPIGASTVPIEETLFAGPQEGGGRIVYPSRWSIEPEQQNLMLIDWCDLPDGRVIYADNREDAADTGQDVRVLLDVPEPERILSVVGEQATLEAMRFNGIPLPAERTTHPASQDLLVAGVDGLLSVGENVITVSRESAERIFEPFYLMGAFGVDLAQEGARVRPVLERPRHAFGDLVECGLPFYWGAVSYETELAGDGSIEWLDCGEVDGVVCAEVNGDAIGWRYSAPYRFRLAGALCRHTNTVRLTLYNTAQNLLGPHRVPGRDALQACRRRCAGNRSYYLAPYGIRGPISVS